MDTRAIDLQVGNPLNDCPLAKRLLRWAKTEARER